MRAAVLSALLVPVFLTGCSTYVTVVSEPEGAVITDASGSIVYGRAPLDVEYDTNELRHGAHPGQCAQIPGFTARWPSGASASTDALRQGGRAAPPPRPTQRCRCATCDTA